MWLAILLALAGSSSRVELTIDASEAEQALRIAIP
jgi:hypothetical protein